jgi:hypothetical protein
MGIPSTVRFMLSRSLRLSQSLFGNFSSFTTGFRLLQSLFTGFSFTRWNLGYHGAFSRIFLSHDGISAITKPFHQFFFHTMESRLSQSIFTNFSFTWWNFGYYEAFSRIFLSHDGISAITEPFHEFFFHTMESWLSQSLFTNFSIRWWNPQNARFGGDSFHIYHKEYLHRIRLIKNLASWFRAPFARKRVQYSLL